MKRICSQLHAGFHFKSAYVNMSSLYTLVSLLHSALLQSVELYGVARDKNLNDVLPCNLHLLNDIFVVVDDYLHQNDKRLYFLPTVFFG
jgi:hypothetical protein